MRTDTATDLAQTLRDLITHATKLRDAHSNALSTAGGGTVKSRGKEGIVAAESAAVDALDALLDSEAGVRAAMLVKRWEWR